MRARTTVVTVFLLAACGADDGLTVHNSVPEVTFTQPASGQVFHEADSVSFTALVEDAETATEDLDYNWSSTIQGALEGDLTLSDVGVVLEMEHMEVGDHTVVLKATDGRGATGSDAVSISITPNAGPVVSLLAPESGERVVQGYPFLVSLSVMDDFDNDMEAIDLQWSGVADVSSLPSHANSDGTSDAFIVVHELGAFALTVTATDSLGATGSDTVAFEVSVPDLDGDGYDDEEFGGDDCNDGDSAVNPGATERCDGIDNDCDTRVDEDGAQGADHWYPDADNDGFGDEDLELQACERPTGYISDGGDCEDSDEEVNPDATEICDYVDNDCDEAVDENDAIGVSTWFEDADGDGYGNAFSSRIACWEPPGFVADNDDCDDDNASASPGLDEYCNGFDDDCDGDVDEDDAVDVVTWYRDSDVDGYGNPGTTEIDCDAPSGFVDNDEDCDDDEYSVNPAGTEYCDEIDNDCDGSTDESDAVDVSTWYRDADGDGFGIPSTYTVACDEPTGYAADDADCDDDEATTYPEADEYCDDVDNDCDGAVDENDAVDVLTWYPDDDGDGYGDNYSTYVSCESSPGYTSSGGDCDDTNALINPGADELCNGRDDDCDEETDEDDAVDADTWYADSDGDGYGDPATSRSACSRPTDYVSDDTDCDDAIFAVHPSATEYCNGRDDNCDAVVDEDTAADAPTWYWDDDADGYGDRDLPTESCSMPSGFSDLSTDCDDTDPDVYPGADEYCNDVDDDCDGTVDEDDALDASTWYRDDDDDGFGDPAATTVSCDVPSGYVADNTDCDDDHDIAYPGGTEIWYDGVDGDCDELSDYDADYDGYDFLDYGGTDCHDDDASLYPGLYWYVPADFSTIQEAIDTACGSDYIEVAAGSYEENIDFGEKELHVFGADGSSATTLDGGYNGDPAVTLLSGSLSGFTITNGLAYNGGAIYLYRASGVELSDLVIDDNGASAYGGGIYIGYSSNVTIDDCLFTNNESGTYGGGIAVYQYRSNAEPLLTVTNTRFEGNAADYGAGVYAYGTYYSSLSFDTVDFVSNVGSQGVGLYTQYGHFELSHATFVDNDGDSSGVGIYAYNSYYGYGDATDRSTLEDISIRGNTGGSYSGLYTYNGYYELIDVSVEDNYGSGGAPLYLSGTVDATGITVSDNVTTGGYGGIYVYLYGDSSLSDVVVEGNQGYYYAGMYAYNSSSTAGYDLTLSDVQFVNNRNLYYQYTDDPVVFLNTAGSAENLVVANNFGQGLSISPSSSLYTFYLNNATVVGNSYDGIVVTPTWVRQVNIVNTISAFNGGYGLLNAGSYAPEIEYGDVYANVDGDYSGVTDPTGSDGNLSVNPEFVAYSSYLDTDLLDLHLAPGSPLIDAGDPSLHDGDGTDSDIGAFAGSGSDSSYYDDADGDGMWDGWELLVGLDPTIDDSLDDPDGDGLTNAREFDLGTSPSLADTDGDTVDDGDEVLAGTDPLAGFRWRGHYLSSETDAAFYGMHDSDYAGWSVAGADMDGDGFSDVLVGAYYADTGNSYSGSVYVVRGPVTGEVNLDTADAELYGTYSSSYAGVSVTGMGDVDGDGYEDVFVGAYYRAHTSYWGGGGWVVHGPVSGALSLGVTADAMVYAPDSSDYAGYRSSSGDLNGDGEVDLVLGAFGDDTGGSDAGAAYLLLGPLSGTIPLTTADSMVWGESSSDQAGRSIAAEGDLNGDGIDDLLVGAPYHDEDYSEDGMAYLMMGPLSGDFELSSADYHWHGDESSEYLGWSLSSGGDLNGDGYDDMVIGAYYENNSAFGRVGSVYVVNGPIRVASGQIEDCYDGKLYGEYSGSYAGWAVDSDGDVDGDGNDDLLIGAYQMRNSAGQNPGAAYVALGPVSGLNALGGTRARFMAEGNSDYAGFSVAMAGDVDGDGIGDMLYGAYGDDTNEAQAGAAFLVLGGGL